MMRFSAIVLVALVCATPALGADANAGKNTFRQQCALCHSAEPGDNGGAQGPNLNGVFGRSAASDQHFGYTKALKGSHLTWDSATWTASSLLPRQWFRDRQWSWRYRTVAT